MTLSLALSVRLRVTVSLPPRVRLSLCPVADPQVWVPPGKKLPSGVKLAESVVEDPAVSPQLRVRLSLVLVPTERPRVTLSLSPRVSVWLSL
jgi:hypothetical protein